MRSITTNQMKQIDKKAQGVYGIPGIILMENAGINIAYQAIEMLKNKPKKICIFCGKGNNGGDGFVAGRHLFNEDFKIKVFLVGEYREVRKEARVNLNILLKMGIEIYELSNFFNRIFIKKNLAHTSLIIDAIFGTGLKGKMPYATSEIIDMINLSKRPVLSVDIPSGLDADTGEILGGCIKATKTITFGLPKKGFFKGKGPLYTGRVIISKIGIPQVLLK
ncbi:MAG: NAD(P)H-hydrate epimerase [Candidatus Omnitrophica bacterium]|nr:NAD(P)H-hydrate epimerase [Candidatus Omnitrophota bacterium]